MRLRVLGFDHRSVPVEIRERFSFNRTETEAFLRDWTEKFGGDEAVLVSTCNRTELYVGSPNGTLPESAEILSFLAERSKGSAGVTGNAKEAEILGAEENGATEKTTENAKLTDFTSRFTIRENDDAAAHLFSVASSLESMVLGEPQILAQIKEAYRLAAENGAAGVVTHSVFQAALAVAKRVSTETEICRRRISVPAVAVADFALAVFETLVDKRTLVLGAGEMATETLRYLKDSGAKNIVVANRNRERAESLASEFGGTVADWSERFGELERTDLVVAATGATEPILTRADYDAAAVKRRGRALFLLDLSVPRNLDPKLGEAPNVWLYSIDDLQSACQRNRDGREAELPKARRIIQRETETFWREMKVRDSAELIRQLRLDWNEVKEAEITRLFNKRGDLTPEQREEIHASFDRLVNKMLHGPMKSLRDDPDDHPRTLLDAMRKLFRLT